MLRVVCLINNNLHTLV